MEVRIPAIVVLGLMLAPAGPWAALGEDRTIDGRFNNPLDIELGSAGTALRRYTPAAYSDGIAAPAGPLRPPPRVVSNRLLDQLISVPNQRDLSGFVWQWGQFLDHDISFTPEHEPYEPLEIVIPPDDPVFTPGSTMTLNRALHDDGSPRQQLNAITHYIDASNVYGSDESRATWLRAERGRLKMTPDSTGDLLPWNDGSQHNAALRGQEATDLFVAGDLRANEQPGLIALHTLFVREHNRRADQLAAQHDDWDDNQIYERARKMVGAQMQVITYQEFLPALLGPDAPGAYDTYSEGVDPRIMNVFSTAAFRLGHSMLPSELLRLDASGQPLPGGPLALRDAFFKPGLITNGGGIEPILRGLGANAMEEIDARVIDDVRNFLFADPTSVGIDLAAMNIQRGREHGLPDFNTVRQRFGLAPVASFAQLTSDPDVAVALTELYSGPDDLDPWIGLLAEDHVPGASVGPTLSRILRFQFEALRDGDRFWYANDPQLSPLDVAELEATTLCEIILRNTTIASMQPQVFLVPEPATLLLLVPALFLCVFRGLPPAHDDHE